MKVLDYNSFINQDKQKVKPINEHLWSGIIHRSETGEVRKENDLDSITDHYEFKDYLNDHFNGFIYNSAEGQEEKSVDICLYTTSTLYSILKSIYLHYYMSSNIFTIEYIFSDSLSYDSGDFNTNTLFSKEFKKKYDIHYRSTGKYRKTFKGNKKMDNNMCVQFLDDFIKMCENKECEKYQYCSIKKK